MADQDGSVLMGDLAIYRAQLLSTIREAAHADHPPDVAPQVLQPIFKLWHSILNSHSQGGLSVRDTAHVILSLKSELAVDVSSDNDRFIGILDGLGMLTFELLAQEQHQRIHRQSAYIARIQSSRWERLGVIGSSPAIDGVMAAVSLVLKNDVTVLLQGETGVGKEVVASIIHREGARCNGPFVPVNCGAIPKDLVESELFGFEKGAFTGADRTQIGLVEQANEGTLFLDEIGDLPLELQVKLLRLVQQKEIKRLGGVDVVPVDVRIIAATHKNLEQEVAEGRFREDLLYRLNVYPITIPPLRERGDDVIALAESLGRQAAEQLDCEFPGFSADAIRWIQHQSWPGNIRQLDNVVKRACILAQGQIITAAILAMSPSELGSRIMALPTTTAQSEIASLDMVEKQAIERAITTTKGNMSAAARALRVSRGTLYAKAKKYGLTGE